VFCTSPTLPSFAVQFPICSNGEEFQILYRRWHLLWGVQNREMIYRENSPRHVKKNWKCHLSHFKMENVYFSNLKMEIVTLLGFVPPDFCTSYYLLFSRFLHILFPPILVYSSHSLLVFCTSPTLPSFAVQFPICSNGKNFKSYIADDIYYGEFKTVKWYTGRIPLAMWKKIDDVKKHCKIRIFTFLIFCFHKNKFVALQSVDKKQENKSDLHVHCS